MSARPRPDHRRPDSVAGKAIVLVLALVVSTTAFASLAMARTPSGDGGDGSGGSTTVPGNASFGCTHAPVDWIVPTGVSTVNVVATGASGSNSSGNAGGIGARVTGSMPVTAGETLHVRVGCSDGFNGGGQSGAIDNSGNGGGATDVRQGGDALANRVVTAAGGGGGGQQGPGGTASGAAGGNGTGGLNDGLGATPTAGGVRGGTLGQGGPGELFVGGGGGGGGVYGGGGSGSYIFCTDPLCKLDPIQTPGGGGGAGSSAGPSGSTIAAAPAAGDGSLTLTWVATIPVTTTTPPTTTPTTTAPPIATTTVLTDSPDPSLIGDTYTVTATVTSATGPVSVGSVAFTVTGVAGTIVLPLTGDGTASFLHTPTSAATTTLHATYQPADGYLASDDEELHTVAEPPDTIAPTVTTSFPAPPASGWFTSTVTGSVLATDDRAIASLGCSGATASDVQGLDTASANASLTVSGEGTNTVACTAQDPTGNTGSSTASTILIDSIAPTVAWTGGPADGSSHVFGSVPAAPTCSAIDGGSGPASCVIAGYSSAVGTHVLTATATDIAGNTTTSTHSYTVSAWQLSGFYSPVDMGGVVNTVKAGSTVPLKFEVFAGGVEQMSTGVVQSLRAKAVSCSTSSPQDEIEVTSTGDTVLRYDDVAGTFVYNWKTPKLPGSCLDVSVQTIDGSMITARFRLR